MIFFIFYVVKKIDGVRIWAKSTDADEIVFSETWLSKSVVDKDICINGHNVYRTERVKEDGGVAMYVKTKFLVSIAKSETICKQLEFLALNLEVSKGLSITVIGCYRPPLLSVMHFLH